MKPERGYFSLIQYCPDIGRLEAANVGVLLFCPAMSFLKAMIATDNSRIIRFFGSAGHDWKRIQLFKQGLVDRLAIEQNNIRSLEDLQAFIALRANSLLMTPPRPLPVTNPEADLKSLFERLVGVNRSAPRQERLQNYLAAAFQREGVESKIQHDIRITLPSLGNEVRAPFGYQNGRFHLIQPVRFPAEASGLERELGKYSLRGRELFAHPDRELGGLKLVVVGAVPPHARASLQVVQDVLERSDVTFYPTQKIPQLTREIRQHGKVLDPKLF